MLFVLSYCGINEWKERKGSEGVAGSGMIVHRAQKHPMVFGALQSETRRKHELMKQSGRL